MWCSARNWLLASVRYVEMRKDCSAQWSLSSGAVNRACNCRMEGHAWELEGSEREQKAVLVWWACWRLRSV